MKLIETDLVFYFEDENKKSQDFGYVFNVGLPKGESEYFLATEEIIKNKPDYLKHLKNVKWAIYDKNFERKTDYHCWIHTAGLVKGQSIYYKVEESDKEALFTLNGQKTEFFEKIRDRGALTGESNYFWGKKNGKFAIYDVNTGEKLTEDFKSSVLAGVILGKGTFFVGSYGEEIFYIFDLKTGERLTKAFDEHKLIEILKHGDLERAVDEIGK